MIRGAIPFVGCGLSFIRNPLLFFQNARKKYGETFIIYMFGLKLFCVFSPTGLQSLYGVRENDASFTEATRGLLGLKLPPEVIAEGDLRKFHAGLRRPLLTKYYEYTAAAATALLATLPQSGQLELFSHMKELMHRVGFACWVGPEALTQHNFTRLVAAFEELDPESSFKDLGSLFTTIATGKRHERAAMATLTDVLTEIWDARARAGGEAVEDNLTSLHALHAGDPEENVLVARDVFHFHLASLANMYAAMSWVFVRLLSSPTWLARVRSEIAAAEEQHGLEFYLDAAVLSGAMPTLEQCMQESLRLAQQSITLRKVMRPVTLATERGTFNIPPGYLLTTLLSATNCDPTHLPNAMPDSTPETFNPDRYHAAKLVGGEQFGVSTFGHGVHACPGQRFALDVTKLVVTLYFRHLSLVPQFTDVGIPATSVGAIGRADRECFVKFTKL